MTAADATGAYAIAKTAALRHLRKLMEEVERVDCHAQINGVDWEWVGTMNKLAGDMAAITEWTGTVQ